MKKTILLSLAVLTMSNKNEETFFQKRRRLQEKAYLQTIQEDHELELSDDELRMKERLERFAYLNYKIYNNERLSNKECLEWFRLRDEFRLLL